MSRVLAGLLLIAGCASTPQPMFISGPQGRLHVSDGGTGSSLPMVFVHGNGANLTQWAAQLAHFRQTRRAVAFDLRGMGRSDVPVDGDYSIAAMVADLHAVVNALNLDRFVLVGHSYGGPVIAAYAANYPERVAGVIYADTAGNIQVPADQWERYLEALRIDKPATVRAAFAPILSTASDEVKMAVIGSVDRTSTEAFVTALEGLREFDVAAAVRAYRGPTFTIAAVDSASSFHVQFPDIPMRRMHGVGHWLMMERPAEFNRIVEEMLARIR